MDGSIGLSLGPYEIRESLGAGGMGRVYRARDTRLGRDVALKLLPPAFADDPERVARLGREAQLLAALNHPNVAAIHTMDEHDGARFLVLELVDGESLQERLRRGPVPVPEAVGLAGQVADALAAAHARGIVHRDLKPANVMVTPSGRIKVLDFGIAKALEPHGGDPGEVLTATGATLGTMAYMSPEQLRGDPVDHRSDVWSFGCLLYELLAGRGPFSRGTGAASMAAVLEAEPDWGALPAATPAGTVRLLERCLERDPGRRPVDGRALREALDDVARPRASLRRTRGRKLVLPVTATVAVVLGGMWATGTVPALPRGVDEPGPITSLAVLPFENLSGDSEHDHIAVAITEMLSTDLGALGSLRVSGRESVVALSGSSAPSEEIARRLGVDALVRGSLAAIGEGVVITARLVDARSDEQLWTDRYEGTTLEIFATMSDAVEAIAREIGALTADLAERLASSEPIDPRAERLFWRGFTELENYSEDPIHTAIDAFRGAIEIEPEYARAHAELARAYLLAVQFAYLPAEETLPLVRASAERALSIDPGLAEARVALARLDYRASRDWSGLKEELADVVRGNPSSVGAWHWYSHLLISQLEIDAAIEAARRGYEVDPLSRTMRLHLNQSYRFAGRWAEALAIADSTLALYPDYNRMRLAKVVPYLVTGRPDEAVGEAEALVAVSREPDHVEVLAIAYAAVGRDDEARALLEELIAMGGGQWRRARVELALGDVEAGFTSLTEAIDANVGPIADLAAVTWAHPLRADTARWRGLLRHAGFPEDLVTAEGPRPRSF